MEHSMIIAILLLLSLSLCQAQDCGKDAGGTTCTARGHPTFCCSQWGYCGEGATYCGSGCQPAASNGHCLGSTIGATSTTAKISSTTTGSASTTGSSTTGGNTVKVPTKVVTAWYCGDDYCNWNVAPVTSKVSWLLNRGDGRPTVNVVSFSFVKPTLLAAGTSGVPSAMLGALSYFQNAGIIVTLSIGGASYKNDWISVLGSTSSTIALANNAATIAATYHVGIEIDFEPDDVTPYLNNLGLFVSTYRSRLAYSATGNPETILTLDAGASTGWPTGLSAFANSHAANNDLNWVYAMVGDLHCESASTQTGYWQTHINSGLAANKLVGSVWAQDRCSSCPSTIASDVSWSKTNGLRGVSYWVVHGTNNGEYVQSACPNMQTDSRTILG